MSPNAQNIINQINKYIRNYGLDAFTDFNLNRILVLMTMLADAGGGGSMVTGMFRYTNVDFVDPGTGKKTDVIVPALDGLSIALFWNQGQKYLETDLGEFVLLPGGGFRILLPGFDASTTDQYQFYATIL